MNARGLRAGWRLLAVLAIFFGLSNAAAWLVPRLIPIGDRTDLDPIGMIAAETTSLLVALAAIGVMALIERRSLTAYGIPLRSAFGKDFWVGLGWGLGSTTVLVGLVAALGGFHVTGLALHGGEVGRYLALWLLASLLIGWSEEVQFRSYVLTVLGEGIGYWPAAVLLSIGFGALHYFLKPHERWEDFASTGLLGLFICLTLRRTGALAWAIGFHAAFDFANLFIWSGQNGGQFAVGKLLDVRWPGPDWLTGGFLGPEASWMVFPVIGLMFVLFHRLYPQRKFPPALT